MEGPGLTRLSSSGLEEKRGLSERTWEKERGRGGHIPPPAHAPRHFTGSPGTPLMVGAHLLGKGCNVFIEGIGGANVTARGCAQPSPSPITGRTRGQFTFLKDQGQQREERVARGKAGGERVPEGWAGVGWGREVWCNREVDR